MYMKVQRSVFCSMVLIFEFLLILMGCGGGGCPTLSRTGTSSSGGSGGTKTSSNVCGTSNGNGSGINGQCTGKLSPTEVLYSFIFRLIPPALSPISCRSQSAAMAL